MVKLNAKALASDKEHLDKQWDEIMIGVNLGKIDQQKAAFIMERLNCLHKFLMAQGMK